MTPTKVVFIAGMGRSGSTLISRLLDRAEGVCAVGELCYLWDQGIVMNRLCGCGEPFADCPFWRTVGDEAYGGWDKVDAARMTRLRRSVERTRFVPALASGVASRGFRDKVQEYAEAMSTVYAAIQRSTGAHVVVDSSKYPSAAYVTRRAPAVELRLVHLVRSSQGVAYSWQKLVMRPDRDGRALARFSPGRTSVEWLTYNAMLEAVRAFGVPRLLVRYEDFIAAPAETTVRILRFSGLDLTTEDLPFVTDRTVDLARDHSLAGNPMRFRHGVEELSLDREWKDAMQPRTRALVTTITAPGLLRYGYGLREHA